jgi:probable F420-dependent oxidoreductase
MEFGLQLANLEPARFRDVAQAAEALGYDLLVLPDHVVMEGPGGQYDPHTLAYDSMTIAALIADATRRIRIGHLVLCNLFRHPVMTAQALMTLDHISGGRLVAGLGSGWTETEFKMTGIGFPPIAERLRMLDEALTCIRSLWTNERTTFEGKFYRFRDAILWPKPIQKPHPPILLGGGGKGLLRIAARHADIVNINLDTGKPGKISLDELQRLTGKAYRDKVSFVRDEAVRLGRKADAVRISNPIFQLVITDSREATRKTAEGMAPMFGVTPEMMLQAPIALVGTPEECAAELRRRVKEWGVTQFIFSLGLTGVDDKQVRRLKEDILAHI